MSDAENVYACPRCDFETTDEDEWDEDVNANFGYSE